MYGALDRYSGSQLTNGQVELFAEFVTLALAAGVTPLHGLLTGSRISAATGASRSG